MKYIYKYTFILLPLVFFLISCEDNNDPEDIFEKDSTERLNEQEKELSELLQSSEYGWKMTYFTDDPRYTNNDQQLGGWTFIFGFVDSSHVVMVSDFSNQTLTPNESEYNIKLGSTIKLSFSTKNYIHDLSDANNAPSSSLTGKGYKGDFEFLYYGQEGEDLIFRSNRFQIEIRFQKATAEDWENISENIETEVILQSSGELQLEISNNGEINVYDLAFSPATRYATNIDSTDLSFGVGYKEENLKVIKPIPVGDKLVTDLVYDSENNWFISELENGDYVKIILGDPILVSDVVNDYYFGALAASGHPINESSDAFIDIFLEARELASAETGLELYGFFIVPDFGFIQYIFLDDAGNDTRPNRLISNYSVDDSTGTLTLQDGGWQNATGESFGNTLDGFHDVLFNSQGLRVAPTGTFYNGGPVFYLISNEDSSISIGTNGILY